MILGSAGAAAAAAAARRRQEHEEEEEVTPMSTDPSGRFEYKILRSATKAFKRPAFFQQVLQEEALAGWELVEKLDNGRVRLRRAITHRSNDGHLNQDPYRITVGMSEAKLALAIAGTGIAAVTLMIALIFVLTR